MVYGAALSICRLELPHVVFEALATAAERRVSDFNTQNLANTAWAFAKAGQSDERLFAALTSTAERLVSAILKGTSRCLKISKK